MAGCVGGYIALLLAGDTDASEVIVTMVLVFLSTLARTSALPIAGTVASFSAAMVVLPHDGNSSNRTMFALDSMVETIVGIGMYFFVSNTLWPSYATVMVRAGATIL